MKKPTYRYWVEFFDHNDQQKWMYLYGENIEQVKSAMGDYKIVVIDNTEISEPCYWVELREVTS